MGKTITNIIRGSTLIEVITASIVWMAVFIASFSILTSLTSTKSHPEELIEADCRIRETYRKLSEGWYPEGEYCTQYSWGKIIARIRPYEEYPALLQLSITASFKTNRKQIVNKYVVEKKQ